MPRRPRLKVAGVPHHVIQRGNNRSPCFFADEDYRFYLLCLQKGATRYQCAVHAYALMTNHVHLLVSPSTEEGLSLMMRYVGAATFSTSIMSTIVPERCGKDDSGRTL